MSSLWLVGMSWRSPAWCRSLSPPSRFRSSLTAIGTVSTDRPGPALRTRNKERASRFRAGLDRIHRLSRAPRSLPPHLRGAFSIVLALFLSPRYRPADVRGKPNSRDQPSAPRWPRRLRPPPARAQGATRAGEQAPHSVQWPEAGDGELILRHAAKLGSISGRFPRAIIAPAWAGRGFSTAWELRRDERGKRRVLPQDSTRAVRLGGRCLVDDAGNALDL